MDDRNKLWSSAGSAGTVNIPDINKIVFNNSVAQLGPGLPATVGGAQAAAPGAVSIIRAVIRYGVTPVDGVANPLDGESYALRLRYRGGSGQVMARLIRVEIESGTETTLVTFDSHSFPANNAFQVQQQFGDNHELDFVNNAYYVELTLTATHNLVQPMPNPPAVSVIQLILINF